MIFIFIFIYLFKVYKGLSESRQFSDVTLL